MNIEGAWEKITPKKAEKMLADFNTRNRKLQAATVEQYAEDMRRDNWTVNPQPIILCEDGVLADGQHRLSAVVSSGVPQSFFVMRGLPREASLNLDTGKTRSLTDNAKIAGWDRPISPNITAAAVWVNFGKRPMGRALSNSTRLGFIDKFEPHLVWAEQHRPRKPKVGTAIVAAAVARAHMHERDLTRLAEFCKILGGELPNGNEDMAAHTLRGYLLTSADPRDGRDLFLKTMNAIRYFMRRKPLTVIKSVKDESYPLPS